MGFLTRLAGRELWSSASGDPVQNALQYLRQTDWEQWCDDWRELHQFLQNRHRSHTMSFGAASHPEASQEWAEGRGAGYRYFPLVRMIAQTLAVAFHRPADTYLHRGDDKPLPATDPQVIQWRIDQEQIRLPQKTKHIEELCIALGNAVVQPAWMNGEMRWHVFAPYECVVLPSEDEPTELRRALSVQVEIRRPRTVLASALERRWLAWEFDGDAWSVCIRNQVGLAQPTQLFEDGVNPYGRHPLVLWQFEEPPGGELWVAPDEVLLQKQRAINIGITDLSHGMKYCSHPQWVEYGQSKDGKEPIFGPGRLRQFHDIRESKLEAVTPQLNTEIQRDTIEWDLQMYAVSLGFPPDTFTANSSTRNLGAKQHEAQRLQMRRESIYPAARAQLAETFAVHRTVANYWTRRGGTGRTLYDDDVRLGVNLMPVPIVSDRLQELQAQDLEEKAGLTSPIEREMEASGVSRDAAESRIARRLEETARLRQAPAAAPVP